MMTPSEPAFDPARREWLRRNSLRRALLARIGVTITAATLLFGFFIAYSVYRFENNAWQARETDAVRAAAQYIQSYLINQRASLDTFATIGAGEVIDHPEKVSLLMAAIPELSEVVFLDREGRTQAHLTRGPALLDQLFTTRQSAWFQAARQGSTYTSDLLISPQGQPYLLVALPAGDSGGVLAARLAIQPMAEVVASMHFGKSGLMYIVDRDGAVIAHPDLEVVLRRATLAKGSDLAEFVRSDREFDNSLTGLDGSPAAAARWEIAPYGWTLVSEVTLWEFYAASRVVWLLLLAGLGGLVVLITLPVARSLDRRVFAPLNGLLVGAQRVARGDLYFSLHHPINDEFGEVTGSFNTMVQSLSEHERSLHAEMEERQRAQQALKVANAELEARVVERTLQLSQLNEDLRLEVEERKRTEERLAYDAFHDALTGLPNRALFLDRLGQAIARVNRHPDTCMAVLFMDLDRFKIINDSLGHSSGDRLLVELAQRLDHSLRHADSVARLGGDEFVFLLEDLADVAEAPRIAERIREMARMPFQLDGARVNVSASLGIVYLTPAYQSADDVLRDADIALYRAKALGKDCYAIFEPTMRSRAITRLELENQLRQALENGEFRLYYQPIYALDRETRLTGFEALMRWEAPGRGVIPPAEFIPVAEETGLIVQLGEWALYEACRQLRAWQTSLPDHAGLTMNLNISGVQFSHPGFLEQVGLALAETQIDPACLRLEITESVFMENTALADSMAQSLRSLGVQLQIDDFGTGYSSLAYLQRFPISTIKIDRSFVSRMVGRDTGSLGRPGVVSASDIVRTIVSMARDLGMQAVAEGIETPEQLDRLRGMKCPYGQGFLMARPMEAIQAEEMLKQGYLPLDDPLAAAASSQR